ncbi:substrate-binding domain-containing protein [Streptomyces sp. NPDC004610]|uniref:substrate-binding domain-containing protein n=1 Tax=unclassified Streptomyces TaxID=2593676 RepID=UPI0033ADB455
MDASAALLPALASALLSALAQGEPPVRIQEDSMKIVRRTPRPGIRAMALAVTCAVAAVAVVGCGSGDGSSGDSGTSADESGGAVTIGIVNLNLSNPFFGTLGDATEAAAEAKGWKVMKAEAKVPGDSGTQVTAIENMIAAKVKAIVVTPANSTALNGVLKRARDNGILVLDVNSPLDPVSTADGTYATDNLAAGKLIGAWAKASSPADPQIAMLDFDLTDGPASGRHDGFLSGYGITMDSPLVAGSALTQGTVDTGQSAMENLLSAHPGINVVYTINEPVAQGAYTAVENKGRADDVIIVSVDGACSGVQDVQDGVIGATAMQFPDKMGQMAVDATDAYLKDGTKPAADQITDSGTVLITDRPVDGVESQTSAWGLERCWGDK